VSEYVEMCIGTDKDISKPSYAILENSARQESLSYCSFGRGKPGKIKFSKSKNVIISTTMHSGEVKERKGKVGSCEERNDYLDMTYGSKHI
jgi:hypothetical protein